MNSSFAFTLLKFCRGSAGFGTSFFTDNLTSKPRTTASSKPPSSDTDDATDDGPFFDLEFTLPDEEEEEEEKPEIQENDDESESEESEDENDGPGGELKFELSKDQNVILSLSDDLFFKGHLLPIEPSSILLNSSENNCKSPTILAKSTTKFRVLLLKLKKSKSEKNEGIGHPKSQEKVVCKDNQNKIQGGKLFFVKFKVKEVPLVTRDSSSKDNNNAGQKDEVKDKDSNEKK
ncbi:Hypothetical predicted protein [Olea europaea subsp. europaea]|uniref:Uncharacterized protein n=1 Tax=Olea europaea subsp. europaea TaxID=158383 RepID=A0A8S0UBI4_OLEEU|nr:Hypothetical predicted protein [Olea europaea subsp. europaea]